MAILRTAEHYLSVLNLLLGVKTHLARWLCRMESIRKTLFAPVVPLAQTLHLRLLLLDKRYNEFNGVCRQTLDLSENPVGNRRYQMAHVHPLILLAMAKRSQGSLQEAREALQRALSLALPDFVYLPLAEQPGMENFFAELPPSLPEGISVQALAALCRRQQSGAAAIFKKTVKFRKKFPASGFVGLISIDIRR